MNTLEPYEEEARKALAELAVQIELLRARSEPTAAGREPEHGEKLGSLETRAKAIADNLTILSQAQHDQQEGIRSELGSSIADLTEKVALHALVVQKTLGYKSPELEGLRLAYLSRANAQLEDLATQIDTLVTRASDAGLRGSSHLQRRMEALQGQQAGTLGRVQELGQSTQSTWEELTGEVEEIICSLRRSLAEAECELNSTLIISTKGKENSSWHNERPTGRRQTPD